MPDGAADPPEKEGTPPEPPPVPEGVATAKAPPQLAVLVKWLPQLT
eukprot:COSAG05_NODE_8278_length_719_cov_0.908065_2_plen_45_part_01